MIWKREADPNISVGLEGESFGDLLYNMLEYGNIYFSKNAFAAKLYVGENGLFLLVPASASDLPRDEKEKTRLKKALVEIKEALGLEVYLYPIFVGEHAAWYWTGMGEAVEIEDLPMFLSGLQEASCYGKLSPCGIAGKVKEISADVAELLMSDKGVFITGADFLIDGGATASYFYGPLKPGA